MEEPGYSVADNGCNLQPPSQPKGAPDEPECPSEERRSSGLNPEQILHDSLFGERFSELRNDTGSILLVTDKQPYRFFAWWQFLLLPERRKQLKRRGICPTAVDERVGNRQHEIEQKPASNIATRNRPLIHHNNSRFLVDVASFEPQEDVEDHVNVSERQP